MSEFLQQIEITERTLIHINGFPFYLPPGVFILGKRENFAAAMDGKTTGKPPSEGPT